MAELIHEETANDDQTRTETSVTTETTMLERAAARSTSPAETQVVPRPVAAAGTNKQTREWSNPEIDVLLRRMKERQGSDPSASDTTTNHTRYSNYSGAKQPSRASSQPNYSNFEGSRTPSGVGIQNPAWNANATGECSGNNKFQKCAEEVSEQFTSELKRTGIRNMDNAVCDKMDSFSTLIQSIKSSKTAVTESVTQSSKQQMAQQEYNSNKEFLIVLAQGNKNVLTQHNEFWNRIMSTRYSETTKREVIEKEIWPKLKTAH